MGGGQQTISLDMIDDKNREWTLRSVDKKVKPSEKFLNTTIIKNIIQDHVSAAYPYAGLSVSVLAKAAAVPTMEQQLVFVPDDSAFGKHRSTMANKVFMLMRERSGDEEDLNNDRNANQTRFLQRIFCGSAGIFKSKTDGLADRRLGQA
jgi:hypothetical protein